MNESAAYAVSDCYGERSGVRNFFHADTEKYRSRLKSILLIVIMPLLAACVFCVVNILLAFSGDPSREFITLMLLVIVGCVLFGMIFTFTAVYFTDLRCRRHAKYTYFDILPKAMIFSLYAGEYVSDGRKIVIRRLYYIPFSGLESVHRNPKENPAQIILRGEIREYMLPSDDLGYHIDENDELLFDKWELNFRCFSRVNCVDIRSRFGSTKRLERSVNYFWEQFRQIPEKKPFDISEHIMPRTKRRLHTSNPALEIPSYDRKW